MPRRAFRVLTALVVAASQIAVLAACEGRGPLDPEASSAPIARTASSAENVPPAFMTRNVYFGADVTRLLDPTLPPEEIPFAAAAVWNQVLANDFGARARALATEIDRYRPQVIGVQEVALYRMQTPADPTTSAVDPVLDFRDMLLAALADRGLRYTVAAVSRNFDVELPIADPSSPTFLTDIRLTDHDLVLVHEDVPWRNPQSGHYDFRLEVLLAGTSIEIPRGWASVDVRLEDEWYRFLTTHLEPLSTGAVFQERQAAELLDILSDETLPTVAAGDFNADPRDDARTYEILTGVGGLTDVWDPVDRGFTCCQAPDLTNRSSMLERRVDLILMRGDFGLDEPGFPGRFRAERFGHRTSDKISTGLWPSDHAGVVAVQKREN